MIEIKHHRNGKVLYTAENAQDVRAALVEAAREGADLRGADLRGAYLQDADLRGAYLQDADLRGAYLQDADLRGAYLQDADLRGADLRGAYLQDADLRGAYLQDADLRGADLRGAYLQDADLRGAYLQDADLRGAYLQDADHWRHPFWATRQDMFSILDQAPSEVPALRKAIIEGNINGSTYSDGECGCLCGTIGIAHAGEAGEAVVDRAIRELGIKPDGSRPAEHWVIVVKLGEKPLDVDDESIDWKEQSEGTFRISWVLRWLDEWLESRRSIAKALEGTAA